jgi:hypothetical protein
MIIGGILWLCLLSLVLNQQALRVIEYECYVVIEVPEACIIVEPCLALYRGMVFMLFSFF